MTTRKDLVAAEHGLLPCFHIFCFVFMSFPSFFILDIASTWSFCAALQVMLALLVSISSLDRVQHTNVSKYVYVDNFMHFYREPND
jgi:hypothetical protein